MHWVLKTLVQSSGFLKVSFEAQKPYPGLALLT